MSLNKNAVAFAATTLASSLMNSVFFFYYVKLFLDKYKLEEWWFQFAQVIYMLWNAINDPLFGYLQDNSKWLYFRSRRTAIYCGAPLWALTFLLPWFQWADYSKPENSWIVGMHLITTLCAYDSMLTFVLLAQCALSAEISTRHEDRLQLVKYQMVAHVIGSSSVMMSSFVSNNMKNFFNLQIYCVCVACVACFCMRYTGANVRTKYESEASESSENLLKEETNELSTGSAFKLTKQIISNKNFLSFVFMNLFQVFHVTFCSNFLLIFAAHLLPPGAVPSWAMSLLYGASFIMPQLTILLCSGVISKFGSYRVVMTCFFIQIGLALLVYWVGMTTYWLVALFFVIDMTLPSACFSLFNILLSDIIDEDMRIHNRRHPQSSMVFGTNALITKPANSFAPMIGVAILNRYGYESLKDIDDLKSPIGGSESNGDLESLHLVMFQMLCFVPIAVSTCQILVWSFYKLRNSHTTEAKYLES